MRRKGRIRKPHLYLWESRVRLVSSLPERPMRYPLPPLTPEMGPGTQPMKPLPSNQILISQMMCICRPLPGKSKQVPTPSRSLCSDAVAGLSLQSFLPRIAFASWLITILPTFTLSDALLSFIDLLLLVSWTRGLGTMTRRRCSTSSAPTELSKAHSKLKSVKILIERQILRSQY